MKTRISLVTILAFATLFLVTGCSGSSEPEVDKNVPMGKEDDKFKPTKVSGAAGGTAPQGAKLGTPGSQ